MLDTLPSSGEVEVAAPRRAGRPRQGEAALLNERILDAAQRLFIERGFASSAIDRIARDSGTMRRSVMHRFASKDALLIAVADRVISQDIDRLLAPPRDIDGTLDDLRAICRNLLAYATDVETAALFRVYTGEAGRVPALSDLLVQHNNEMERRIERIILDIQQQGAFQRFSASALSTSVICMMVSNPINRLMMGDEQFIDPHRIELYFSQMWAIFLAMR